MVSKAKLEESRKYLKRAREQLDKACVDSWDPAEDAASCITNSFYAYENVVVALAIAHGRKWTPKHDAKAGLAKKFFELGILRQDVSGWMIELNGLRKDVSYGEPGPELANVGLEEVVSDLERMVDEVDAIITSIEEQHS
jgi:uncharacterized protein (UPF0332 family)